MKQRLLRNIEFHMNITMNLTTPAFLFCLTLASGFIMHHTGLSGNVLFTTVHKLSGVAAIVTFILQLVNVFRLAAFPGSLVLPLILSGLFTVALIGSGAMLTIENMPHDIALLIHRIATLCVIAGTAFILYFIKGISS